MRGNSFLSFLMGIIIGVWLIIIIINLFNHTYKDGQIDALTGKVHYQLVVQPDSTRTWEFVQK